MADPRVPKRLQWAVQLLDISPTDEILEIGPGPGVSVSLICGQLATGRITAIDRSATAIQRATKRNADHVAAGKAVFHQLDLADVDLVRRALTGQHFDKVFAVNINLFWVRPADAELQLIKDLLRRCCVLATCGMLEAPLALTIRSPRRVRPTRPPAAESQARRPPAHSGHGERSGRTRVPRRSPWRYGPA
jgi:trans-aconitate methyltransferase